MTPTIKPIETVFKGYKFRSRLEARWAVFFDALGAKWRYEAQGYDLGEAGWYLPDFEVGGAPVLFVEIKPAGAPRPDALLKAEWLAHQSGRQSGRPVVLVCGEPWPGEYGVTVVERCRCCDPPRLRDPLGPGEWAVCNRCRGDGLHVVSPGAASKDGWVVSVTPPPEGHCPATEPGDGVLRGDEGLLGEAFRAARGARFEHEARGAPGRPRGGHGGSGP